MNWCSMLLTKPPSFVETNKFLPIRFFFNKFKRIVYMREPDLEPTEENPYSYGEYSIEDEIANIFEEEIA